MNRRKFLTAGSGAALIGLSGCNAVREVVRTGPPHFTNVQITGPKSVEIGEEFHLTVSAKNNGGKSGDFTTTLTIGEGPFSVEKSVKIPSIPVTKRKSTKVGPFDLSYSGDFHFRITDHAAKHGVTVNPWQKAFGEAVTLWNNLKIAPTSIEFAENLYHDQHREEANIISPGSNSVFAFLHFSVENTGGESAYLSTSSLSTNIGTRWTELKDTYSIPNFDYVEGKPFSSEIGPGESGNYWLLLSASRDELSGAFDVSANRDGGDTRPEIVWTQETTSSVPNTELTNFEAPSSVEIASEFEVSATLKNTGDAKTTFHTIFAHRDAGTSHRKLLAHKSVEIGAGESATITQLSSEPVIGDSIYWLEPFEQEARVSFEPATRSFGRSYTDPDGVVLTVSQVQETQQIVLDDYSNTTLETKSGEKAVLAHVEATNPTDSYQTPPNRTEFKALTDTGEINPWDPGYSYMDPIKSPVTGSFLREKYTIGSGKTMTGWLLFVVSSSVSLDSLKIQWQRDYRNGEYSAKTIWS